MYLQVPLGDIFIGQEAFCVESFCHSELRQTTFFHTLPPGFSNLWVVLSEKIILNGTSAQHEKQIHLHSQRHHLEPASPPRTYAFAFLGLDRYVLALSRFAENGGIYSVLDTFWWFEFFDS